MPSNMIVFEGGGGPPGICFTGGVWGRSPGFREGGLSEEIALSPESGLNSGTAPASRMRFVSSFSLVGDPDDDAESD